MQRLIAGAALVLLAGCRGPTTDDWLAQLKDPEVVKRRQAVRELAGRRGEAARVVPALAEALRDGSGFVRRDAAVALGKFGLEAKPAVPLLMGLLNDRDAGVRRSARQALHKVGLPTVAPFPLSSIRSQGPGRHPPR